MIQKKEIKNAYNSFNKMTLKREIENYEREENVKNQL